MCVATGGLVLCEQIVEVCASIAAYAGKKWCPRLSSNLQSSCASASVLAACFGTAALHHGVTTCSPALPVGDIIPGCVQSDLVTAADVAAAWQMYPETAPFHKLSIHVPRTAANETRAQVTTALVQRLGGHLCSARGCDVCVLCRTGVAMSSTKRRRKPQGALSSSAAEGALDSKPRCKAGTVFVTDAWVAEAVQKASRPDFDAFVV